MLEDKILPPDEALQRQTRWGSCSICNIPLSSEQHALEHINSAQHLSNEAARGLNNAGPRPGPGSTTQSGRPRSHSRGTATQLFENGVDEFGNRRMEHAFKNINRKTGGVLKLRREGSLDRKRHRSSNSEHDGREAKRRTIRRSGGKHGEGVRTVGDILEQDSDGDDYPRPEDFENLAGIPPEAEPSFQHDRRGSPTREKRGDREALMRYIWIIATEDMLGVQKCNEASSLNDYKISVVWNCIKDLCMKDVLKSIQNMKGKHPEPQYIILHVGINDLSSMTQVNFQDVAKDMVEGVTKEFPLAKIVWSQILPREKGLNPLRAAVDDETAAFVLEGEGHYIRYPSFIEMMARKHIRVDDKGEVSLTSSGENEISNILKGSILSIVERNISIVPSLNKLPKQVNLFVKRNLHKFGTRTKRLFMKTPFRKKRFPFSRR